MKADLIIHNAGQLLTCASGGKPKRLNAMQDLGVITDGAVAVRGGKIAAVGGSAEILAGFETDSIIDAEGRVVCPGFVDPHTHIVFAGERLNEFELKIKGADYLEILAAGGGILNTVKQTRAASIEKLVDSALFRLDKMMEHGTTTAEIKTGYGLDTETELKMLEAIFELGESHPIEVVPTFLPAHAFPAEYRDDHQAYVDLICGEMLERAMNLYRMQVSNSPVFVDVFCEKNAFNLQQTQQILEKAKEHGFGIKAHVDEFTNLGGARLAIGLGATSIDHLDAISDEEISLLAGSDTVGIITPTVNFNFGSAHYADARKMIDAGCAIALSTDYNPGSAPCPSQPMAMQIACRYQKLLPSEAFNAITINAAFGMGLGDRVGSLEVGKQADILILETKDYREVAYEFGSNFVNSVFKAGEDVFASGEGD
jgi:imidazolonepropionase